MKTFDIGFGGRIRPPRIGKQLGGDDEITCDIKTSSEGVTAFVKGSELSQGF